MSQTAETGESMKLKNDFTFKGRSEQVIHPQSTSNFGIWLTRARSFMPAPESEVHLALNVDTWGGGCTGYLGHSGEANIAPLEADSRTACCSSLIFKAHFKGH